MRHGASFENSIAANRAAVRVDPRRGVVDSSMPHNACCKFFKKSWCNVVMGNHPLKTSSTVVVQLVSRNGCTN